MEYAAFLTGRLYLFGFEIGGFAILSSDYWVFSRPHVRWAAVTTRLFIRYRFPALVISIVGSRKQVCTFVI
jgi:hypothetical protein